jgi:uncharacterized protein
VNTEYIVIFVALALGGLVKGALGACLPVVAVPVLASFFSVPYAIAILVMPTAATNIWQLWQFRHHRAGLGWLTGLCVAAGVGIAVGTWLLANLPGHVLGLILAVMVIIYIAMRLARPDWHIPLRLAARIAPAVGLISGILQGATGISAPVSLTFASSLGFSRPQFVFAVSALFVSFAVVQIPSLVLTGILTWHRLLLGALAFIPILLAMPAGNWLATRLSHNAFNRLLLGLLAVIAAKLIYDSLQQLPWAP